MTLPISTQLRIPIRSASHPMTMPPSPVPIQIKAPASARVERETPMLCHAPATARRLDIPPFPALDLLELFAFVHPARFCVPTPGGLAVLARGAEHHDGRSDRSELVAYAPQS